MSRIKITRKQINIGIGISCLLILILSTFAYVVTGTTGTTDTTGTIGTTGSNNSTDGTYTTVLTGSGIEMYLMVSPNNNSADYKKMLYGSGDYIEYLGPGTQLEMPLNSTVELIAYVFNNEPEAVAPEVIVYQGSNDPDNSVNLTILYDQTSTYPVRGGTVNEFKMNITPAYASNKSFIGVALVDTSGGNATMLCSASLNATVF